MPKTTDVDKLKATLEKVRDELSSQDKEGAQSLQKHQENIQKILDEGLKDMDPGLHDLIVEVVFHKPFSPFPSAPRPTKKNP